MTAIAEIALEAAKTDFFSLHSLFPLPYSSNHCFDQNLHQLENVCVFELDSQW